MSRPISEDALSVLPPKRGVVLLLGEDDKPIVVLPAAHMRNRTMNRLNQDEPSRLGDLHNIVHAIAWKCSHSHFQMDLDYLELVRRLWPKRYQAMLAWKPSWFVHVDLEERYPYFSRTREVYSQRGTYLGPFPDGASAGRFIETLQDAFDLCRDVKCLRQSPSGRRCAYGEMGKCLSPCDGTISAGDYKRVVEEAFAFAKSPTDPELLDGIHNQMKQAAGQLEFERAGRLKARLERIGRLDNEKYRHVKPVKQFNWLMIQRGPARRRLCTFFVQGGAISQGPTIKYPPSAKSLDEILSAGRKYVPQSIADPTLLRFRIGLVGHYLFTPPRRGGIIIRWNDQLDATEVLRRIEESASDMKLIAIPGSSGDPPGQ